MSFCCVRSGDLLRGPLGFHDEGMSQRALLTVAVCLWTAACGDAIEHQPFCVDNLPAPEPISRSVTWTEEAGPIVLARCANCHEPGGVGPFPLTTYEEAFAVREGLRDAVVSRTMPPWLAAPCCNTFFHDTSLTAEQVATLDAWVAQGAPRGPDIPVVPLPSVTTLSRVDVTATMTQPYTPQPTDGRIDDFRCFVLDWPLEGETFVTGLQPRPGARSIVHHLIVATVQNEAADALKQREGEDGRPGFPCEGGLGNLNLDAYIGGSLLGGDFPDGIGAKVNANSKLLLNIHYSLLGKGAVPDQTAIEFRVDDTATETKTMVVANPFWLMGTGMLIEAGDPDKVYSYQYDPALLLAYKDVELRSVAPHMHALGSRMKVAVVRANGDVDCLAEFVNYDYGWEQPFWFAEPIRFERGDELYIQCHFDNSLDNQPLINGQRPAPKAIAWGTDNQEMCAAFITYTEVE